jgi:hypothetical protein
MNQFCNLVKFLNLSVMISLERCEILRIWYRSRWWNTFANKTPLSLYCTP